MFAFLRKIRRSILVPGSAGKYLLYALGEITLVVVGILIALQINNWNERNKQKAVEVKILKELEIALNHDIRNININIRSYQDVQRALHIIKEQLPLETPTNDSLDYAFRKFLFNNSVAPNIGAYETLRSKGLDLISNDSIRQQIIDVYEKTYKYYQDKSRNLFLSEAYIHEYCAKLFNDLSYIGAGHQDFMVPNDYEALQKDLQFMTIINTRVAQVRNALLMLDRNLDQVERLKKSIQSEISRME